MVIKTCKYAVVLAGFRLLQKPTTVLMTCVLLAGCTDNAQENGSHMASNVRKGVVAHPPVHELGQMRPGEKKEVSYELSNLTGEQVTVQLLGVSCGKCLSTEFEKAKLKPGGRTTVGLEYEAVYTGSGSQFMALSITDVSSESTSPSPTVLKLYVNYSVSAAEISVNPPSLVWHVGGSSEKSLSTSLSLRRPPDDTRLRLTSFDFSSRHAEAELNSRERPDGRLELEVKLHLSELPRKKLEETLRLYLNSAIVSVPVRIIPPEYIEIVPSKLNFGLLRKGESKDIDVRTDPAHEHWNFVKIISGDTPGLSISLKKGGDNNSAVSVSVHESGLGIFQYEAEIVLENAKGEQFPSFVKLTGSVMK